MVWWPGLSRKQRVGPDWYREQGRIGTCVKWHGLVAARIKGRKGSYVVFGSPRALDCTCHARHLPCPHVEAVAAELDENGSRFVDLRRMADGLDDVDAEALERALLTHPGPILDAVERNDLTALAAIGPAASVA
jgi:uncharacterized Zn finger protein